MTLTDEMQEALKIVEETTDNLFITGKAGTGKTTLLRYLCEHSRKRMIITAPTGVAAINSGGMTLHRVFNIPFEVLSPTGRIKCHFFKEKSELFQRIDTLVIDEISMARPDVLDYIDRKLRIYRHRDEPFGGIQVVMFGDLFQLPPVIKKNDKEMLDKWYKGNYFFHAFCWRNKGFRIVELNRVFRQQDEAFVQILNRIREYTIYPRDKEELAALRSKSECENYNGKRIHICSLRRDVDKINSQMIGEPTHCFGAKFSGRFNAKNAPCDVELKLRVGARVMMLINDARQGFYNGSMGTVSNIIDDKVYVFLDSGKEVFVEPYTWKEKEYELKDDEVLAKECGECTQYPLALGWAITIHKSQGLTFDSIAIHCPYAFSPGMLYVALSRCTTMEGIVTNFFISEKTIIVDKELLTFNKAYKNNGYRFDVDVYRAFCRYMNYESQED